MKGNRQLWAGAAALVVLLGAIFYLWPSAIEAPSVEDRKNVDTKANPTKDYVKAPSSPPKSAPASPPVPSYPQMGVYGPYAVEKLANASRGPVVLFFNSKSCAACQKLDADIRAHISSIPRDVTILEVDYDTNAELKQKYGVQAPHLIVQVDVQGNRITQWGGSATLSEIATRVVRF